jgi:integrase
MRINGHGQARVLKQYEIIDLFYRGFRSARDKAIFGLCLYTACRISEARQTHYVDVFDKGIVRDAITIRKGNTKGKLETRTIATHKNLAKLLERYHLSSEKLLKLREIYGGWTPTTSEGGVRAVCLKCGSFKTNKDGSKGGIQKYKCLNCKSCFNEVIILDKQAPISAVVDSFEDTLQALNCSLEPRELHLLAPEFSDQQLITSFDLEPSEPVSFTYPLLEKIPIPNFSEFGIRHSGNFGFLFANPENPYLFPGQRGKNCITATVINTAFNEACERVEIIGAGTHSLRRTTLTTLHRQNMPLRVIQQISGHQRLVNLQKYLEVEEEEVDAAIDSLS